MDYDDVIKKLGNFGRFHIRLYIVLFFPVIFNSFSTPIIIFFIGDQAHRCKIPDWQNDTFAIQSDQHAEIVNSSIPINQDGKYSECDLIQNGTKEKCTEWVYDLSTFSNTVPSQFNLVCDRNMLRPHAMTSYFIGYAASTLFMSIIGDIIGRRLECCICLTCLFITNISMPFSTSVYMFAAFRFFDGFFASSFYRTTFIMGLEFVSPQLRLVPGTIILIVYCLGAYILILIAYFIRDWRWLQLAVATPMAIPLIYWWPKVLPESPRWLLSRGRKKEAIDILKMVAKINNTPLDEDLSLLTLERKTEDFKPLLQILKDLFHSRKLVIRWIIIALNWFVIAFIYYGLTMNVGKFGGSLFSNYAVSVTAELIGSLMCLLLDKTGRKPFHIGVLMGGSLACFLTLIPMIFLDKSFNWLMITFAMIGKLGVSAAFGEIFIYTGELFPTVLRSFIMGLSGAGSRVGSILSPYLFYMASGTFGKILPFLLYGILTFVVGILSFKLPETTLTKLPQQVDDVNVDETTETFSSSDESKYLNDLTENETKECTEMKECKD
ncbi:organic cation transporter protein-like isoform X2 [Crassostrea virginica]